MNDYILEVCVDSAESALAAAKGGASRLELCQNLVIGGTTPGPKLFEVIRRQTTIPIHALIRPRFGDFCYTPYELEEIREEVAMYRELGAEGVVVGVLKEDGTMNMAAMEQLMEAADGMSVTLHHSYLRSAEQCGKRSRASRRTAAPGGGTHPYSGGRRYLRGCDPRAVSENRRDRLPHVRKNRTGEPDAVSERKCEHGTSILKRIHPLPHRC